MFTLELLAGHAIILSGGTTFPLQRAFVREGDEQVAGVEVRMHEIIFDQHVQVHL